MNSGSSIPSASGSTTDAKRNWLERAAYQTTTHPFSRFARFWAMVILQFWKNRCQIRASALAYTTLLALVPLLAVSLSMASVLFRANEAAYRQQLTQQLERVVDALAPTLGLADATGSVETSNSTPLKQTRDSTSTNAVSVGVGSEQQRAAVTEKLLSYVDRIHFGTLGVTAMIGLIFVAIGLLRTIEATLNDIWGVTQGRSWFQSTVLYWAAITLGPIVILTALTSGYVATLESGQRWLATFPGGNYAVQLTKLLPLLILAVTFSALYRLMPNTHVDWQAALVGGVVAAVLWWVNNRMGTLYNTQVVTYTGIYGSLGVLPLFLVGLYFSWLILLFGAQTAYTFQYRKIYLQERIGEQASQFQRELFALRIMAEIGRRFHLHLNPTSAADIAVKNGIPSRLCGQLVQALATDRLLIENGGAERTLTPAKPLDQITVSHILDVVRGSTQVESNSVESDPDFVLQEFESVQFAAAEKGKLTTLKDLVGRLSA